MDRFSENPEQGRFELAFDGGVAFATYRTRDADTVVLTHTEVPQAFSGKGIGSRLARNIFDTLKASGRKAVIRCSFLASWIRRNPDYRGIVDPA